MQKLRVRIATHILRISLMYWRTTQSIVSLDNLQFEETLCIWEIDLSVIIDPHDFQGMIGTKGEWTDHRGGLPS